MSEGDGSAVHVEYLVGNVQFLLDRAGRCCECFVVLEEIDIIDLFEHNEAFATASCAVKKELNVPDEIFNVNGGAVALGHPIGCSGARVLTTLLYALKNRNKEVGCGTLCLGGGNAVTMIIRRC